MARICDGKRYGMPTILDRYTREYLIIKVARRLNFADVVKQWPGKLNVKAL